VQIGDLVLVRRAGRQPVIRARTHDIGAHSVFA
jgi:hypothetical protein